MKIPSDISYIRKISAEMEEFLRSRKVNDSAIFDIRLCVEEVVKNAIIHGNKGNRELPVNISYALKGNEFSIEVEDQGEGFKPEKVPDPTKGENLYREGGRGVFLIHKLMDKIEYNDRGNKIFMVKFIDKDKGEGDAG